MSKTTKIIWHVSRILLGLVFIFSGFVKGIDPWGLSFKITDYFNVWNMDSLTPAAFTLGVVQSAFEFIIGITLLFDVFISLFAWISVLFMGFFTVLTFWIALKNPVTDCGCFGDALVLTNWETFYKNIFFSALAVIVFIYRHKLKPKSFQYIPAFMALASTLVYGYLVDYSYNHLPIIDFRPFKIGVNIADGMIVPDDAPKDIYKNTFKYENLKSGEIKEFTEKNYPWQDTLNWKFVSMDNELIQKGYEPPIHNFQIETPDGEDIKDFFLYDEKYTFFYVAYDLDKANLSTMAAVDTLAQYAMDNGMNFIGLTSSLPENIEEFREENNIPFELFNCDETTLKTMIRSDPGLMLLKKGTILYKWHYNDIPKIAEFQRQLKYLDLLMNKPEEQKSSK